MKVILSFKHGSTWFNTSLMKGVENGSWIQDELNPLKSTHTLYYPHASCIEWGEF